MNHVWINKYNELFLIFLSFPFLYLIHHYELLYKLFERVTGIKPKQALYIYLSRIFSTLLLGFLPFILVSVLLQKRAAEYGFSLPEKSLVYYLTLILCLMIFPLLLVYSKNKEAKKNIPRAHPEEWNTLNLILNTLTWLFYLTGYEFYFRGLILFSVYRSAGTWSAIAIMTSLYTSVHITRGKDEAWGSIIMGFLGGFLALYSKSILPPLIIHFFISITMDTLMITRYKTR